MGYVTDSLANVGELETRGVDLDMSYGFDIGPAGKIRTNLIGTYVDEYVVTPIANTTRARASTAPGFMAIPAVRAARPRIRYSTGAIRCARPGRRPGRGWT